MEKLRFKDENGNTFPKWEIKFFSEIYHKAKEGGTPSTKNNNYYINGEIPFVKIDDLKQKYIVDSTSYINEVGIKNSSAWRIPINSLLLSNGATIGESSITKAEVATKQGILGIIPKINVEFLYYLVDTQKFKKELKKITTKGTMDAAYIKDIANIKVDIPCENEQNKIADFLSVFDLNIEKVTQKIEQLQRLKKGYLQKMFPKKGENVPEIRFNGFTDTWEQCKFNDLAETKRGLTYKPKDVSIEGIRVLRSSNINKDYFEQKEDDVFVVQNAINIDYVKSKDILITSANGSSRLVGKHAIITNMADNTAVHGGFMLLARTAYPYFLNASMSSRWYEKFINLYVAGGNGAIGNLSKSNLDDNDILSPSDAEKFKIGELFKSIDTLITLHQRKHESLTKLKQGYMQRLFSE